MGVWRSGAAVRPFAGMIRIRSLGSSHAFLSRIVRENRFTLFPDALPGAISAGLAPTPLGMSSSCTDVRLTQGNAPRRVVSIPLWKREIVASEAISS